MTKPPPTKGERLVHDVAVYYANKNDSPTAAAGYMPAHKALLEYIAELEAEVERLKEYEWMYKDLCK